VAVVHLWTAIIMYGHREVANVTSVYALLYSLGEFGISAGAAIPILIVTSVLALVGAQYRLGWLRIVAYLPQQVFLMVMAAGGPVAAYLGHYLDNTASPTITWAFISTDQMWVSCVFVVHLSGVIRRLRDPNG